MDDRSEAPQSRRQDLPGGKPIRKIGRGLAWLGVAASAVGVGLYFVFMDVPFQRSTAAITFALIVFGCFLNLVAVGRRRSVGTAVLAAVNIGFLFVAFWAFFVLAALPTSGDGVEVGDVAPTFTLVNHEGRPVSLAEVSRNGPVWIVFYRGWW